MPSIKEISIALGLLTSDHTRAVDVDGWQGYVWRVRDVDHCTSISEESCQILEARWDWKRRQFYNFSIKIDIQGNQIISRIELRNEDLTDKDNVCIVAAFLDGEGQKLAILFANWPTFPGRNYSRNLPIRPLMPVSNIHQVTVGTKQCKPMSIADAENYQRLRQELRQR